MAEEGIGGVGLGKFPILNRPGKGGLMDKVTEGVREP